MPGGSDLRQKIEDLALRLVLEEPGGAAGWAAALDEVRAAALQQNAAAIAAEAAGLLEAVRTGSAGSQELQQGLLRLQRAAEDAGAAPAGGSPAEDIDLLTDFALETREHLAAIEAQALTLERDPSNAEALHAAFRAFHSIKGLAGFLELGVVQELAHEVEAVLDRARNGLLAITPDAIDVILHAADHLQRWVAHVERMAARQQSAAPQRDENLLMRIRSLCSAEPAGGGGQLAAMAIAVAGPPEAAGSAEPEPSKSAAGAAQPEQKAAIKVDTAKLDSMVEMAGELVIAESLLRHDSEMALLRSPDLQRKMTQLGRITSELQKTAMALRLVPVGPLFRRMVRLARDLARQIGKRVEMELAGSEIELDRTIVEELGDPLLHMIRNAIDHGIETPAERERAGKPPVARLLLKAQHQAGQVLVEIADDGRGLDRAKIVKKALERGLIASEEGLSDAEVHSLIFHPGFSTAAQVTSVSGRGVGMDVVRRHIEKLRGRIDIRSTPGQGASFLIKLPLTLAIIDGLVVGVGAERYILPLFSVREMIRPGEDTVWTVQNQAEMALVRGTLLPVVRLHQVFGIQPRSEDPRESVLVVAELENERYCLLVDELIGKQEVVIKSLGKMFENVAGVAGGAILGDGRVGLILDLERLFRGRHGESPH
ncbi:MAG TPA: chemotaxis protein CheA [Bryobacteraceae bacterium]|jgi:two-component system chemotaxis sensor kinase CheA|nr:chemotaxis protein CheA [Bryobacteraceae bacterium]